MSGPSSWWCEMQHCDDRDSNLRAQGKKPLWSQNTERHLREGLDD